MSRHAAIAASASLVVMLAAMATARAANPETLVTATSTAFGTYLSDAGGRAVYLFTADGKDMSTCTGACVKAWPPMMSGEAPLAGPGVDASLLGTIPRAGGMQVTYAGRPLYHFVGDGTKASTAGEAITHFGGSWYLVAPNGNEIAKPAASQAGRW